MWDLIVQIPDHCLSIYFPKFVEQGSLVSVMTSYFLRLFGFRPS